MSKVLNSLQKVGRALMTPIAVMPIAALLLRFGAGVPGITGKFAEVILKAGDGVFANMALIFAIGIAFGLAKNNHGAAALAGAVGYHVMKNVYEVIDPTINTGVLGGIVMGIVAGMLYNKYHNIKLPDFLGFFGGKRFVPIITSVVAIFIGLLFGFIWPVIQGGLDAFGNAVVGSGGLGQFLYGFLNRLLIPVGLHHVLNSIFWFTHGEFVNTAGEVINGDLFRFLAGDKTAGVFMTGFFPVMMFGLPAAGLAFIKTAKKENKAEVVGLVSSIALTAFLTGITEPLEFSFVFLAPGLYVFHAFMTGLSLLVTNALGILHGFGFSAGFIDYVVNYNLATKPILLLPIGLIVGAIYYSVFVFAITKFDLKTPGRTDEFADNAKEIIENLGEDGVAKAYLKALGGKENIKEIDACITRLRLVIADTSLVNDNELKKLGASGVVRPSKDTCQVIIGPKAEMIAEAIRNQM
ncbi:MULTISPECIES: N-acetylglucosamine-specific PTS transporter subunit IIBC [unclassified Fusibacter]|uniref:N-acetylglucosamine-specific PTS transporter subunit IIBC n=1 Tax=unclassified Fusibacter TaxID=2624464 RepID=UPI0010126B14|nr:MULTISPECIES: N-acetylglucosamine-specific PTS transporter subunit IIBC [unclassified Fusibacter]MCK8061329.1 N-acetylglucosamine-specific PTS transporter subunit IIBC [Fusibacter sp. A2]NPE23474.1 PTS transporter subunit EIIC [Fusibacter sp. A1]RXV59080.1 PTS sugar transporter [Fusibacter sp. A1]